MIFKALFVLRIMYIYSYFAYLCKLYANHKFTNMNNTHGIVTNKMAIVKVVLVTSKTLANGEHLLILRITKNKARKHISIGMNCLPKYWDISKQSPRANHPQHAEVKALINPHCRKLINGNNHGFAQIAPSRKVLHNVFCDGV